MAYWVLLSKSFGCSACWKVYSCPCACIHFFFFYVPLPGAYECACVVAALFAHFFPACLEDSYASVLFFFLLRLKEQQAVTAPWALTDHSPRPGCQGCRQGSATSHRGAVGAVQPVSRAAALGWWAARCQTAPSSAQCLLHYSMLFCFQRRLRWGAREEM